MTAGRVCVRTVQIASPEESVRAGARRMREAGVGTLVVVDEERAPIGMLTDRDVALRCVAEERDPETTTIRTIMSEPVVCIPEATALEDALGRMAGASVRRVAVTDPDGRLAGILALDDVVELLAEEAETIGRLLTKARR